ncbi:MAG: zinc ribbon domain-containing protein [Bacilli bacterium]
MYCKNCGEQIDSNAAICIHCGVAQSNFVGNNVNPNYSNVNNDSGSFGYGVLGCCFPIVGLILFLVWKDEKPKSAKAAGIGALIPTALLILYYLFIFMLAFIFVV